MRRTRVQLGVAVVSLFCGLSLWAQQGSDASPSSISSSGVPRLASFSGVVRDASGKLKTGVVTLTFSLYAGQEGGTPLWSETQDVQADDTGHYTVLIGATAPNGLPLDLFTTGTARWLGVQPALSGAGEQPRVLLVGMPYALKAADADTLGGKPLSAFQLAPPESNNNTKSPAVPSVTAEQSNEIVCSSGTACKSGFIPQFSSNGGSSKLNDSIISQRGTTVGINGNESVAGSVTAGTLTGALGVTGQQSSSSAAVSGTNTGTGFGVFGTSSVASAIWGENTGTTLGGSDGVHGVAHSATASGVAGVNAASGIGVYGTGGTGVFGTGSGFGFSTDSNVQQARTAGGWVKAMVLVNAETAPYNIVRCFNSTLAGATATTPPCGFNVAKFDVGTWIVDFGFEVDDRFLSLTLGAGLSTQGKACTSLDGCVPLTQNQVLVNTFDTSGTFNYAFFYLIVF